MKLTIPNILTLFRFFLIPVFVVVFLSVSHLWAFVIFVLAWVTDVLDGRLARLMNCETQFGRWADPLADKLMALAAFCCLAYAKSVPLYFFFIFLTISSLLVLGAATMYFKKKDKEVRRAEWIGKFAWGVVLISIAFAMFNNHIEPWATITIVLMWLAVVASLSSFIYYYFKHYRKSRMTRT